MSDPTREHAGQNHNRSPKHTPKHIKRPMHLRSHDPAEPLGRPGIRPWHVALSVVLTASLVVAGLHTDAIADVLGLTATAEPTEVTETAQPAAGDAGAATFEAAPAAGSSEELASAERETEETGRAAAKEMRKVYCGNGRPPRSCRQPLGSSPASMHRFAHVQPLGINLVVTLPALTTDDALIYAE